MHAQSQRALPSRGHTLRPFLGPYAQNLPAHNAPVDIQLVQSPVIQMVPGVECTQPQHRHSVRVPRTSGARPCQATTLAPFLSPPAHACSLPSPRCADGSHEQVDADDEAPPSLGPHDSAVPLSCPPMLAPSSPPRDTDESLRPSPLTEVTSKGRFHSPRWGSPESKADHDTDTKSLGGCLVAKHARPETTPPPKPRSPEGHKSRAINP